MSERDVLRAEVLTEVLSGRRTVASAVIVLAVGERQIYRLLIRFREDGGGALIHKSRGQPSNHSLSPGIREYALELVKEFVSPRKRPVSVFFPLHLTLPSGERTPCQF